MESKRQTNNDQARPCRGQRRAYRHHKRHDGVTLLPAHLVPLSADQAEEATSALAELMARHRDRSGS